MRIAALAAAALFALLHLLAEDALGPFGPLVKMTPVLILGILVLKGASDFARRLAAFGLLLGGTADAVIEFSFLGGLAIFLAAHLFYIAAFVRIDRGLHAVRLVPVALWAVVALPVLVGHAGALKAPVLVYGLVIVAMMWRAAAAWDSASEKTSGEIGLVGALFFGLSDTLLGYSRFVSPLPASSFLIMTTYWAGQSLIALSFLKRP